MLNQKDVAKIPPARRGYWSKRLPNGEKKFCFKVRENGKKVYFEMTLKEIEEFLKQN